MAGTTCRELLDSHLKNREVYSSSVLQFDTEEPDNDVYNISAPFEWHGERYIMGRVEKRDSEFSKAVFFTEKDGRWVKSRNAGVLDLQDPFYSFIKSELVVGGVEVWYERPDDKFLSYHTVFYRGTDPEHLVRFAQGPPAMKDIRLHELPDGRIILFTRPNGKIGQRFINSLSELNEKTIADAALIPDRFAAGEWGGVNEIHILHNGHIGMLSHIACYDKAMNRHYYSAAFSLNMEDMSYTPMKMIACRDEFMEGPSKRPDLRDVIFSGGLVREGGHKAELYCGVSDASAQRICIDDPFEEYEK